MGESEYGLVIGFVVVVLLWLRFYLWPKKTKSEKAKEAAREEARAYEQAVKNGTIIEVPPLDPAEPYHNMFEKKLLWKPPGSTSRLGEPMGPSAPTGLPDMTPPDPPLDGKFGPEYLTGALKQESEEALHLLHTYTDDAYRKAVVERTGNPDWAMYYAMAADWLGALRWYRKVVDPQFTDSQLLRLLSNAPARTTSATMDAYRSRVPPGPDLDQALRILGFYQQFIRTKLLHEVKRIIVRVLIEIEDEERRKAWGRRK
jgi:hypothetical protein